MRKPISYELHVTCDSAGRPLTCKLENVRNADFTGAERIERQVELWRRFYALIALASQEA